VALPGTAKTSRPCSSASLAVMSDPLRGAASTTTVPRQIPLISRFRTGKWPGKRGGAKRKFAQDRAVRGDRPGEPALSGG